MQLDLYCLLIEIFIVLNLSASWAITLKPHMNTRHPLCHYSSFSKHFRPRETGGLGWSKQSVLFSSVACSVNVSFLWIKFKQYALHCYWQTLWQILIIFPIWLIKGLSLNNTERSFLPSYILMSSFFIVSKCHNQHWEESPAAAWDGRDGDRQDQEGGLRQNPGAARQQGAALQIRVWGQVRDHFWSNFILV